MTIELKISGDSPDQIATQIVSMALLFAPKLRDGIRPAAEPNPEPGDIVADVEIKHSPAEPAKRPGRPKKTTTIEHDANEGKTDAPAADDKPSGEPAPAEASGDAAGAAAKDETPAEVDAVADDAPASREDTDALRKFVIGEYLNVFWDDQPARSEAYRALLDKFGLDKIASAKASQVGEIRAFVEGEIAQKAAA